ncbi:MAG: hypothetical protein HYV63_31610 [Candidatus Schekmanbacteria bacterium]|nr:hypothetical protein [Candidatus Schekmanbacteria bacterium]
MEKREEAAKQEPQKKKWTPPRIEDVSMTAITEVSFGGSGTDSSIYS